MIKNYFYDQYLIFSCKIKNEIVSSLLILYTNQFAHCHLIGSNELARKLSANNMLHHEVIKWCKLSNINIIRTPAFNQALLYKESKLGIDDIGRKLEVEL